MRSRSPLRVHDSACDTVQPVGLEPRKPCGGQALRNEMWGEVDPEWTAGDDAAGFTPLTTVPTYRSTAAATGEFCLPARLHGRVNSTASFQLNHGRPNEVFDRDRLGLPLFDLVPRRRFGSWSMVEEWTSAHGAAMKPAEPDRVHARFLAHVARGIARPTAMTTSTSSASAHCRSCLAGAERGSVTCAGRSGLR
jgi:hypothetical protein